MPLDLFLQGFASSSSVIKTVTVAVETQQIGSLLPASCRCKSLEGAEAEMRHLIVLQLRYEPASKLILNARALSYLLVTSEGHTLAIPE